MFAVFSLKSLPTKIYFHCFKIIVIYINNLLFYLLFAKAICVSFAINVLNFVAGDCWFRQHF
jgi:hypothetical protein